VTKSEPDSVLVEQVLRGDGDSFTSLCERYYVPMVAIAHALLGDRHLAEDAAQQALAKAAVSLPSLRKPEQFGAWLAAICRNAAKDLLRSSGPCRNVDEMPEAGFEPNDGEVCDAVRAALQSLEPSAREVIFLRFYDGLSYEQISAVLGISEQAINGRLRRAKRTLADYLRRQGFDEVQM
jgi:RNA polymerase sigma-70 factor (ECF subfamily)